jgi:hypothetical protein
VAAPAARESSCLEARCVAARLRSASAMCLRAERGTLIMPPAPSLPPVAAESEAASEAEPTVSKLKRCSSITRCASVRRTSTRPRGTMWR